MNQEQKNALFEQIYRENEHDMYKVALYYAKQEEAAAEITQKAFYHVFLHIEKVDIKLVRAYVGRAIRNLTYNWVRDNKIAKMGNIEDYYEDVIVENLEDIIIRKEEKQIARKLASDILSALYDKNKRWYDDIVNVYYLDIPQEQVAKDQGVEKEVISSRLYRAKQWIRQNFREQYLEAMGKRKESVR